MSDRLIEPAEWLPNGQLNPGGPGMFVLHLQVDRSQSMNRNVPRRVQLHGDPPRVGEYLILADIEYSSWLVTSVMRSYDAYGQPNGAIVNAEST